MVEKSEESGKSEKEKVLSSMGKFNLGIISLAETMNLDKPFAMRSLIVLIVYIAAEGRIPKPALKQIFSEAVDGSYDLISKIVESCETPEDS